jgi:hypothetical protein
MAVVSSQEDLLKMILILQLMLDLVATFSLPVNFAFLFNLLIQEISLVLDCLELQENLQN